MGKERQIVVRMTASQHDRLEVFQRRIGAASISQAVRACIELTLSRGAPEQGTVGDDGHVHLLNREQDR